MAYWLCTINFPLYKSVRISMMHWLIWLQGLWRRLGSCLGAASDHEPGVDQQCDRSARGGFNIFFCTTPGWLTGWLAGWRVGCVVAWLLGCLSAWLLCKNGGIQKCGNPISYKFRLLYFNVLKPIVLGIASWWTPQMTYVHLVAHGLQLIDDAWLVSFFSGELSFPNFWELKTIWFDQ